MEYLKKFVKKFSLWEWLLWGFGLVLVVVLGIVFKSGVLITTSSVLGITAVFLCAKGMVIGCFVEIAQLFLYCTMSWFNRYYGEILVCALVTFPTYLFSIITWLKNRQKGDVVLKVSKTPKLLEWILLFVISAILSVGAYFLLRAFNTSHLIVSTIGVGTGICAGYLSIRRSEFSFLLFLVNNILCIILWLTVVVKGDLSYIPTVANYAIFMTMNIFGFVNWLKLKRQQKKDLENSKIEEKSQGNA